jgi:hypothetical protein
MNGEDTQTEKTSADAVVICEVWRSAMALKLSVVTGRVLKWSINAISNPNSVDCRTHIRDNMYTRGIFNLTVLFRMPSEKLPLQLRNKEI